ncbi:glycerophosphodiester phosphodiesterase family protein [Tropicimonas sp. TH_r6]|uniref:glycerophosphodiester phosphodiesterase family protein n=1 Tax=Tropicimonas sp. TH_r6 TaxID=3082085 RepID=UPI002952D05D|nr:glycerophosphodiester phosphodiesterase family protein [Tropicimonas sp. TH_r6]MDV7143703.1 glycerophosphodiester phosphodiesterase family protein [Tropicimonas sp. TH_r6]
MTNMPMRAVSDAFHDAWRLRWPFVLSRFVFGFLVLALLAPITTLALRGAIALSGQPALSDFDIAMFLLSPIGFVAALFAGGLVLTGYVLNIAFMMAIALHARRTGERRFEEGVGHILPRFRAILGFAIRFLLRIVLLTVPFLAIAALVASRLLGEFDINYYLTEHPPEFLRAVVVIGVTLAIMLAALVWALLGWAFALPLVLFEGVHPARSFAASRAAVTGRRMDLLIALLVWGAVSALAVAAVFGVARLAAGLVVDSFAPDLEALAAAFLIVLAVWSLVNLFVTSTTSGALACLLMERAGWPGADQPDKGTREDRHRLRMVLVGGSLVAAVAAGVAAVDLASVRTEDEVEVIAHRGAAGARPENTMSAFALAIEDAADWIELDVQESAEGEVIVAHDSDFMKLAGDPLKVWDATAETLAGIDIGSWFAPDYAAERVPLLSEVLEMARDTGSGVLIELKYYGHDEKLEQRVAEVVEAAGMEDQVQLMSLKYEAVQKMKALRPDWSVGLLASAALGRPWELEADFLAMNKELVTHRLVRSTQEAGKQVHVWTVNDPLAMSEMLSLGVNGLITDEPALAREVIAQRADLGTLERVVLALGSQLGLVATDKVYRDGSP